MPGEVRDFPMADTFERMLKDLQNEHTRQLAELSTQIVLLREEIDKGDVKTVPMVSSPPSSLPSNVSKPTGATHTKSSTFSSEDILRQTSQGKVGVLHTKASSTSLCSRNSPWPSWMTSNQTTNQTTRASRATMAQACTIFAQGYEITESCQPERAKSGSRVCHCVSCKSIVESSGFEAATAAIIIACTVCSAMEAQFVGMKRGYSLEVAGYGRRDDLWEGGVAVLTAVDIAFSILFILEFLGRLVILKCSIFFSIWSWLDLIVVLSSVLDLVLGGAHSSKGSKTLRMIRIVKVTRLLKALRSGGHFFNVLHVLMASIRSSFSTLCWTLIMIIPVQVVCALIMIQILDPFYDKDDVSTSKKQAVFLYFGTFSRSLITFFEILFANYATPCRVLINNVGEEYGVYIIAYRCICGFSVLCVVQAVFLQQSMRMVAQDSEVMIREKKLSEKKFEKNLERLFASLDTTGDGHLAKDEFLDAIHHNEEVHFFCHALGLDPHDLEDIYHMVDAGAGVSAYEFMQAAKHIRKQARTIDMARVLANEQKIRNHLEQLPDILVQRMGAQKIFGGQRRVRATTDASTTTDMQLCTASVDPMPDFPLSKFRL